MNRFRVRAQAAARQRRNAKLAAALTEQRRQIARDLHDGLAQELSFISCQLQRLDGDGPDAALVRELQAASGRALLEARLAIEVLRIGDAVPLADLVGRMVASFQERFGIEVRLELASDVVADGKRRAAVLRILGQALTNAVAHGGASHVTVRIRGDEREISLLVTDDGVGFDPRATSGGWGLVSMRERTEVLGGSFHVASRPGAGTEVAVALP